MTDPCGPQDNLGEDAPHTLAQASPFERLETMATGLRLRVEEGPDAGKQIDVVDVVATGGRGRGHPIALNDPNVSDTHFELRMSPERGLRLRDLGSRNGTWVSRVRLWGEVELCEGASFHVGGSRIRVVAIDSSQVQVADAHEVGTMYGRSITMRRMFALLRQAATSSLDLIIEGEPGVGKSEAARTFHAMTSHSGSLIVMDCADVDPGRDLARAFDRAKGGTVLLDDLDATPLKIQAPLLRTIEARPAGVCIVATTRRNLAQMAYRGAFHDPLLHGLGATHLLIPPLRERKADLAGLSSALLRAYGEDEGIHRTLAEDVAPALCELDWPGNVRQLRAVLRRTAAFCKGDVITANTLRELGTEWSPLPGREDLREGPDDVDGLFSMTLKDALPRFKAHYCKIVLERCGGDIEQAATNAGYGWRGFVELLKRTKHA